MEVGNSFRESHRKVKCGQMTKNKGSIHLERSKQIRIKTLSFNCIPISPAVNPFKHLYTYSSSFFAAAATGTFREFVLHNFFIDKSKPVS